MFFYFNEITTIRKQHIFILETPNERQYSLNKGHSSCIAVTHWMFCGMQQWPQGSVPLVHRWVAQNKAAHFGQPCSTSGAILTLVRHKARTRETLPSWMPPGPKKAREVCVWFQRTRGEKTKNQKLCFKAFRRTFECLGSLPGPR